MEWTAVKSGWLYERKSGIVLKGKWEPRWVVIYGEPVPAIGVYEQRSDAVPPYAPLKHFDLPKETEIKGAVSTNNVEKKEKSLFKWIRRASVDVGSSMLDLTMGEEEKERVFWINRPKGLKMCFMAKNRHERDEWIGTIKGVLHSAAIINEIEMEPRNNNNNNIAMLATNTISRTEQFDSETLTCAGVVVMEGRVVARIKAGATTGSNPLSNRSNSNGSTSAEVDSIVNAVTDSCAVINEPSDILDDLHFKYQQAMIDKFKLGSNGTKRDLLRVELQIMKCIGQFHSIASQKLKQIVDEYHSTGCTNAKYNNNAIGLQAGVKFEDGSLKLMFIVDYANVEEEMIAAAYAWLRQEMNAARWIAGKKNGFNQPLMTLIEYKGFRALAMISLPVGKHQTTVLDIEAGVMDENVLGKMKDLATELNLIASFPYRTSNDGHVLQISLSPSIEIHRIETTISNNNNNNNNLTAVTKYGKVKSKGTMVKTPTSLYATNVHDIMPAYPTTEEFRGLLYFRPEFIESLATPVAPGDMQSENKVTLLKMLCETKLSAVLDSLEDLQEVPLDSEEWRSVMHRNGLNMALLGMIAQKTKLPHVRDGAIIEMIGRIAKIILRTRIRNSILHFREVQALRVEEELRAIVLETLNGILGHEAFWMNELGTALEDRFGYKCDMEILRHQSRDALLMSIAYHAALCFKDSIHAKTIIEPDDFLGFGIHFSDAGNGPYSCKPFKCESLTNITTSTTNNANNNEDVMSKFAMLVLPAGEGLWLMEGRRAAAAKALLCMIEKKTGDCQWDEAMKLTEFATGLCPKHHPVQALLQLQAVVIKTHGPANLAWRQPVLGEKPSVAGILSKDELILEELRKAKTMLIHRVDKHFEGYHPLGIEIRLKLAQLLEATVLGRDAALELRGEVLAIACKILGRRHVKSRQLVREYSDALFRAEKFDQAIAGYSEALKLLKEDAQIGVNVIDKGIFDEIKLMIGLMNCWKSKENYEIALEWANQCRSLLESNCVVISNGNDLEYILEEIAELSLRLYATEDFSNSSALKMLASEEIVADSMAIHLQTAMNCYAQLFENRRNRHDINTSDGEALLRLVRKIILLTLRLAGPAQKSVIKAAVRRKLFQRDDDQRQKESIVRDLLVRMVSGPATPQEMVEKVLGRAMEMDTLAEAERELALLLDLIELVE